jgi:hypothetical protein
VVCILKQRRGSSLVHWDPVGRTAMMLVHLRRSENNWGDVTTPLPGNRG